MGPPLNSGGNERTHSIPKLTRDCFNGAAAEQRREHHDVTGTPCNLIVLQWGRR